MNLFEKIIDFFLWISIGMSILQLYLRANKIWKRKWDKEVAESQSIFGLSLLLLNCSIWIISYIIKQDYESIIDTSIIMIEASIFLLIGTGLWVKGQKRLGLWNLIKQSLRLERKEANYLIKRFFKPQNAEVIISILHQLAMIDEELDSKEKELITAFAKEWNIDYSTEKLNKERLKGTENNYIRLRNSLIDYLDREPPVEQVAQLKDMMTELINADDKITEEEELITSELMGIIETYLKKDENIKIYHVIIVPQKQEDEETIKQLLPDSVKVQAAGGVAYSIGSFYSYNYADMICKQFRKKKLFTIVHSFEEEENNNNSFNNSSSQFATT
jgi:hypothetical protein